MADFQRPASEQLQINNPEIGTGGTGGGTSLSPAAEQVAIASIKNFLPSLNIPPVQALDKAKIAATIQSFQAQIKNLKNKSATLSKTKGKTGKTNGAKALAGQLTDKVGNNVPGIAKCLPRGTNLNKTTFNAAINTLQASVVKMQQLLKTPVETPPAPVVVSPVNNVPVPTAAIPEVPGVPASPPSTLINVMGTPGLIAAAAQFAAYQQSLIQPQKAVGGIGGGEFRENVNNR